MKVLITMKSLLAGVLAVVFVLGSSGITSAQYIVDFEGAGEVKVNHSPPGTVTLSGIQWNMTEARILVSDAAFKNDIINGIRSASLYDFGSMTMLANKTNGLGTISFNHRRFRNQDSGNWKVEYSTDGTSWTQIGTGFTASTSVQVFSGILNSAEDVRIRIRCGGVFQYNPDVGYDMCTDRDSFSQLMIDDLILTDYVPGTPTLNRSRVSLTNFFTVDEGGPSSEQSFWVSGTNLTGSLSITESAGFEISTTSGGSFSATSPITLLGTGGSVEDTTIYVRLKAGLTTGAFNNETISITSTGATSNSVIVSGEVFDKFLIPYNDGFKTQSNFDVASKQGFNFNNASFNTDSYDKDILIKPAGFIETPTINLGDYEGIRVTFHLDSHFNRLSYVLSVQLSTDNGATYTEIGTHAVSRGLKGIYSTGIDLASITVPTNGKVRFEIPAGGDGIRFRDFQIDKFSSASASLTTSAGYRLMSAPGASSYATIFSNQWLQGMTGITGNGSPLTSSNILTYSESTRTFSPIENASLIPSAGTGFLYYHFNDDNNDGTSNVATSNLTFRDAERSAPTLTLSFTEEGDATDRGWHLLGNPFASNINAHSITGNPNINGVIYVYDHTGNTYRVWNGAGSLSGGRVAPFQAFWVQVTAAVTGLQLGSSLKSTDAATFYKDGNKNGVIQLSATSEFGNSEAWITIGEEASVGLDRRDAYKLAPLDLRPYLNLATQIGDNLFDMNNIPSSLSEVLEIPLHVDLKDVSEGSWVRVGGDVNLSWPRIENLTNDWVLELVDLETGTVVNMLEKQDYSLRLSASLQKSHNGKPSQTPTVQKSGEDFRLILRVGPGVPTSTELESDLPAVLALSQNYPNPFNPTTRVSYEMPAEAQVSLAVYDLLGRQVAELVNGRMAPGTHVVNFNAESLASGVYVYRLEVSGVVLTQKMTLIK